MKIYLFLPFSFLMMVPKSLQRMKVVNVTIDFSTVLANVELPQLTTLDLSNHVANRKKPFNSNEIKAIAKAFPKLDDLNLDGIPIDDEGLQLFFTRIENLCNNTKGSIFIKDISLLIYIQYHFILIGESIKLPLSII